MRNDDDVRMKCMPMNTQLQLAFSTTSGNHTQCVHVYLLFDLEKEGHVNKIRKKERNGNDSSVDSLASCMSSFADRETDEW